MTSSQEKRNSNTANAYKIEKTIKQKKQERMRFLSDHDFEAAFSFCIAVSPTFDFGDSERDLSFCRGTSPGFNFGEFEVD